MRLASVMVILRREYLARVRTKGFWIATIAMPLLMAAMLFVPSLLLMKTRSTHRLAIVDETGRIAAPLAARLAAAAEEKIERTVDDALGERQAEGRMAKIVVEIVPRAGEATTQRAALDARVLAKEIDSWLWIGPDGLTAQRVEYHAENVSNFLTQRILAEHLSSVAADARLAEAGLEVAKVRELTRDLDLDTIRISATGSRAEAGMAGFFLAYFLFLMLYIMLAIYGAQVMNGVLEEKTSRVVEVVLSTTKPFELMLGKLAGIGLVGLTQLAIWLGTAVVLTTPALVASLIALPAGVTIPTISPLLLMHFLLLFVLGYFLFASIYAAIASACNNIQEAQQLAGFAIVFLVAPMLFALPVINDPDAPFAVVTSLVPIFTPLLMMLRIAVKTPPLWQIALGYLLTTAATLAVVWLASRVYRIGILMYGKKPTFRELWRWLRHA